ncbi:MAG: hypothetical protein IPJ23_00915 [Ignavibacteriales bacterium]|nr:hypothetical protein [Ignavibacteriales bacterium]
MISFRVVNLSILIIFIVVTFLSLLGVVSINVINIGANVFMLFGISYFYSSYVKHYRVGVFFGSVLFLIGTILFVFSKFEIWNFGTVFVPSVLIVVGLSLLISTVLIKLSGLSILFSALCLFAGVWLLILRGTATVDLYLSAVYNIFKDYWVIFLFLGGIIILTTRNFKNKRYE